jgi:23S rRNA (pseudouridine1915-N3)-methyltransferase
LKLILAAIGRLRGGPEADMTADYINRAAAAGRRIGFGDVTLKELEPKPEGDQEREAAALRAAAPPGGKRILLDERGEDLSSRALASILEKWRDGGQSAATFWIGGADGVAPALRAEADLTLAFGRATWPHRLVRVMAAEQVYRTCMILCANPYHRD